MLQLSDHTAKPCTSAPQTRPDCGPTDVAERAHSHAMAAQETAASLSIKAMLAPNSHTLNFHTVLKWSHKLHRFHLFIFERWGIEINGCETTRIGVRVPREDLHVLLIECVMTPLQIAQ